LLSGGSSDSHASAFFCAIQTSVRTFSAMIRFVTIAFFCAHIANRCTEITKRCAERAAPAHQRSRLSTDIRAVACQCDAAGHHGNIAFV
jgi:hypothetical protein